MNTRVLYRPVGLYEAELVLKSDLRAFPPRLPEQPFFYPVLNLEYAEQIARDWNAKDAKSGHAGFVTRFQVSAEYLSQFEEHIVGSSLHHELWIPAEILVEFNGHIVGQIEIIQAFYGAGYKGIKHHYSDWFADEMFSKLYEISLHSAQDFSGHMTLNRNAILLSFSYWIAQDYSKQVLYEGEQERFLRLIADLWRMMFPEIPLLGLDLIE